jgi:5-formyltetrahydrofolate cyclo-ligase
MRNASETKAALRQQLRAEAARHTSAELAEGSRAIGDRLAAQDAWRNARTVLMYSPLPGEPDLQPLVKSALEATKTLAFPRFDSTTGAYQICQVTDPASELVSGQFGILEPRSTCPVCRLNALDFALVPGIGFSLNGCRLGRGKGYFDRMLSEVRGWKCGVAFDWQVTVEIPTEPHDIRLNSIVTPSRWHLVRL